MSTQPLWVKNFAVTIETTPAPIILSYIQKNLHVNNSKDALAAATKIFEELGQPDGKTIKALGNQRALEAKSDAFRQRNESEKLNIAREFYELHTKPELIEYYTRDIPAELLPLWEQTRIGKADIPWGNTTVSGADLATLGELDESATRSKLRSWGIDDATISPHSLKWLQIDIDDLWTPARWYGWLLESSTHQVDRAGRVTRKFVVSS